MGIAESYDDASNTSLLQRGDPQLFTTSIVARHAGVLVKPFGLKAVQCRSMASDDS